MSRDTQEPKQQNLPKSESSEKLVPAMFASNIREAERSCALLRDHKIEASIGEGQGVSGVPVLVPDRMLDAASELLSTREIGEGTEAAPDSAEEELLGFGREEDEEFDDDFGNDDDDDDEEFDEDDDEEALDDDEEEMDDEE